MKVLFTPKQNKFSNGELVIKLQSNGQQPGKHLKSVIFLQGQGGCPQIVLIKGFGDKYNGKRVLNLGEFKGITKILIRHVYFLKK